MTELFVREQGEGPTVLLLHSSGMSSLQWRRLIRLLSPTHRVVAPDLVGVGHSPPFDTSRMRSFDFREDVTSIEALASKLPGPVHLVGHSYGGLLAFELARRGAFEVASLTAYEPVVFGVLHATRDPSLAELPPDEAFFDLSGGLDAWLGRFVDWWSGEGMWELMPEAGRAAFSAAGPKVFAEVQSLSADRTPPAAYATIDRPTLLLSGEYSPLPARRVCEILAEAVPNARHVVVEDAGHMGPLTHADEVNALVAAAL